MVMQLHMRDKLALLIVLGGLIVYAVVLLENDAHNFEFV